MCEFCCGESATVTREQRAWSTRDRLAWGVHVSATSAACCSVSLGIHKMLRSAGDATTPGSRQKGGGGWVGGWVGGGGGVKQKMPSSKGGSSSMPFKPVEWPPSRGGRLRVRTGTAASTRRCLPDSGTEPNSLEGHVWHTPPSQNARSPRPPRVRANLRLGHCSIGQTGSIARPMAAS